MVQGSAGPALLSLLMFFKTLGLKLQLSSSPCLFRGLRQRHDDIIQSKWLNILASSSTAWDCWKKPGAGMWRTGTLASAWPPALHARPVPTLDLNFPFFDVRN